MFNWVCPRCGRENSPSYTECPDCRERDKQAEATVEAPPQPPQYIPQQPQYAPPPQYPPQYAQPPQYAPQQQPPPQYAPQYAPPQQYPPQQYPPQPPQYAPPQYAPQQPPQYAPPQQPQFVPAQQPQYAPPLPQAPAPKPTKPVYVPPSTPLPPEPPAPGLGARLGALPAPLLILLFAVLFLLIGAAGYFGYQKFGAGGGGAVPESLTPVSKTKSTNPLQKYIEVVGIRLTTDAKKHPVAKFLVVNHASTAFSNLGADVTLRASTSRSDEDAIGSFTFHVENLGPYDSKEISVPFKTNLKVYELPDWQNAVADVQITSPQQ